MENIFSKKIAWITGASSGIGEELVYQLNQLNCITIISARRVDELIRVQKACQHPDMVYIVELDLEQSDTFNNITAEIISRFERIDFLFNNGGVSQRSYADQCDIAVDRKIMEINYFGNIALTKAVLPYMIGLQNGHIIATSSVAGKYGFFLRSAYAASKHALEGFYESLRLEQKENHINISTIIAGPINTNISSNALTSTGESQGFKDRMQEEGLPVNVAVRKILNGVIKKKEEIHIGRKELIPIYIKRFFPSLFTPIMLKQKP